MGFAIRKKVSLDFLGDEYKDSFLVFKAIPVKDYEALLDKIEGIGENNKESIKFIVQTIKDYFISGKAPNDTGEAQDVTKEDLDELDQESVIACFKRLTGQSVNEDSDFLDKDLSKPSTTTDKPPSNS